MALVAYRHLLRSARIAFQGKLPKLAGPVELKLTQIRWHTALTCSSTASSECFQIKCVSRLKWPSSYIGHRTCRECCQNIARKYCAREACRR